MVNAQLKRQSVKFVKRLDAIQKFVEVNTGKQNKIITGQIISLLDFQTIRRKAPIFTWWQRMGKYWKQRENIPWIDSIHVQSENTTTYSAKGYSKVHNAHKTRSYQAFTRVQMFPMNGMGKATGNKSKGMKCKLDTGPGINIMPLLIYNPSEFNEQSKPIDGLG